MEERALQLPDFRYRSAYTWANALALISPVVLLVILFSSDRSTLAAQNASGWIALACFGLALGTSIAISLGAALWVRYSEGYQAFQRSIYDWAFQNYHLVLTPKQLRALGRPLAKRQRAFLPPEGEGAQPLYSSEQGWYTSVGIHLDGSESSAPALAGRQLNVALVSRGNESLLVTVPFGEPLPRGAELRIQWRADSSFTPYSTASIAGLFTAGILAWLALCVAAFFVLSLLDPNAFHNLRGSPARVLPVLAVFPALPLFQAGSKRVLANRRHR